MKKALAPATLPPRPEIGQFTTGNGLRIQLKELAYDDLAKT